MARMLAPFFACARVRQGDQAVDARAIGAGRTGGAGPRRGLLYVPRRERLENECANHVDGAVVQLLTFQVLGRLL